MKILEICGASNKGITREENQDCFLISNIIERDGLVSFECSYESEMFKKYGILLAVADGMGGHQGGAYASQLTLEILRKESPYFSDFGNDVQKLEEKIRQSVLFIHQYLIDISQKNSNLHNMGSTLVGLYLKDETIVTFHIGDSRLYRLRDKYLNQLTQDHSLQKVVKKASISHELQDNVFQSSIITNSVGGGYGQDCHPKIKHNISFLEGDMLMLCSDGLTDMLSVEQMEQILNDSENLYSKIRSLINESNNAGGKDNITVILMSLTEEKH